MLSAAVSSWIDIPLTQPLDFEGIVYSSSRFPFFRSPLSRNYLPVEVLSFIKTQSDSVWLSGMIVSQAKRNCELRLYN